MERHKGAAMKQPTSNDWGGVRRSLWHVFYVHQCASLRDHYGSKCETISNSDVSMCTNSLQINCQVTKSVELLTQKGVLIAKRSLWLQGFCI